MELAERQWENSELYVGPIQNWKWVASLPSTGEGRNRPYYLTIFQVIHRDTAFSLALR
jgi:hypothetical protein